MVIDVARGGNPRAAICHGGRAPVLRESNHLNRAKAILKCRFGETFRYLRRPVESVFISDELLPSRSPDPPITRRIPHFVLSAQIS